MSALGQAAQQRLLDLARNAVTAAVKNQPLPTFVDDAETARPGGCFVTLLQYGELRGCIGTFEASDSLSHNVAKMAAAAALKDPRFPPVTELELPTLKLDISVLSVRVSTRADDVVVGRHGLWIERGTRRGVLLPQVATEHSLDREQFLAATCQKAGLPANAWREADTRIEAFTAQVFGD